MSSRRNQNVLPTNYDVHITSDLDSSQFSGSVKIEFIVKHFEQSVITLCSSHLTIDTTMISLICLSSLESIEILVEINETSETIEIRLSSEQKFFTMDTTYRLTINSFSGLIATQHQIGFYRSTVDILSNTDGKMSFVKKHYGITQMSPTHCRRVFPCFDEPSLRATFDLTLDIPRHLQALSNMPPLPCQDNNLMNSETKRIRFQRTPSMPTFLLCFVIGEFDVVKVEPVERRVNSDQSLLPPIELTAYTLPGRKQEASFALNCARQALHYYADLFQIDYPMAKLDLVAVPDLFYPAMEDWALILFKEEEMLINEDHAVSVQYRNVCQSVTHEIAHQWFGNLVSIHWWNDVYVVEGFAKWFEYLATDHIIPEQNVFFEFFSTQFVRYFDYCVNILHHEPDDIDEKDFSFEGFIYSKGSCLMRMLHLFVGQNRFLDAIRLFLRRYSYRSATAMEFWACVEETTQMPIRKLVHSWCTRQSYPVVQVQIIGHDETMGKCRLELKQMSFCRGHDQQTRMINEIPCHCAKTGDLLRDAKRNMSACHSAPIRPSSTTTTSPVESGEHTDDDDQCWIIPITILHSRSDSSPCKLLMTKKAQTIHVDTNPSSSTDDDEDGEPSSKRRRSSSSPSWFKLNVCCGGPYRVHYSSEMLVQLAQAIVCGELNTFDRFNLENDLFALALGGYASLVDYLRLLTTAYVHEFDDELVWKDIESNLIRIGTMLEYDKQLFEIFRQFIIRFHQPLFERIGWSAKNAAEETVAQGRLRCFLLVILGTIGHDPKIVDAARAQFTAYLNDPTVIILWPVCAIVAHHASESEFNGLLKLWLQRPRLDDRLRCAYGLSYVQDPCQIQRVLDLFENSSYNNHVMRSHERIECYKGFCLSRQGRFYYQQYIENNWTVLRTNYNDEYLEALVRETFGYFATKEEANRIEDFFQSYETFQQKYDKITTTRDTPETPCTRIAVHLCLDDTELSTINKSSISPLFSQRPIVPIKVKEFASIIAHTTRTRAALLERDRDALLAFFHSDSLSILSSSHDSTASSQILPVPPVVSSPCSPAATLTSSKRKRRLSSLNNSTSSPSVRNLLASDASV